MVSMVWDVPIEKIAFSVKVASVDAVPEKVIRYVQHHLQLALT